MNVLFGTFRYLVPYLPWSQKANTCDIYKYTFTAPVQMRDVLFHMEYKVYPLICLMCTVDVPH